MIKLRTFSSAYFTIKIDNMISYCRTLVAKKEKLNISDILKDIPQLNKE